MDEMVVHPAGEEIKGALVPVSEPIAPPYLLTPA